MKKQRSENINEHAQRSTSRLENECNYCSKRRGNVEEGWKNGLIKVERNLKECCKGIEFIIIKYHELMCNTTVLRWKTYQWNPWFVKCRPIGLAPSDLKLELECHTLSHYASLWTNSCDLKGRPCSCASHHFPFLTLTEPDNQWEDRHQSLGMVDSKWLEMLHTVFFWPKEVPAWVERLWWNEWVLLNRNINETCHRCELN